jgi:hypothetical protein
MRGFFLFGYAQGQNDTGFDLVITSYLDGGFYFGAGAIEAG